MPEKTTEQVLVTTGVDGQLSKSIPRDWYRRVREMRRDPTMGFLRDLYLAPMLSTEWTVIASDPKYEDAVDIIWEAMVPRQKHIVRHAVRGLLDFGWQPFEKVFRYSSDGWVTLDKLKPLLQDVSYVLVNVRGEIKGVRNMPTYLSSVERIDRVLPWVDLSRDESLVLCRDVEGTDWYGEPLMRRAIIPYDSWNECEVAAKRFDTKIAGAMWVCHYPVGRTRLNGVMTDNEEIAETILGAIKASGAVAIPRKIHDQVEDLNDLSEDKLAWRLELVSASGSSESQFVGRQKYLDALKARAIGIPERAIFEGQFGTKAEAEAHADFAIDNIEMAHVDIIGQLNHGPESDGTGVVDQLLRMNKGEDYVGHVEIRATPLSDVKRARLRELYMKFWETEHGQAEETDAVDWDALREELGYPTREDQQRPATQVTAVRASPGSGPPVPGEFGDMRRRQAQNAVKFLKDIRRDYRSGEMSDTEAAEMLQTLGLPSDRSERLVRSWEPIRATDHDEELVITDGHYR